MVSLMRPKPVDGDSAPPGCSDSAEEDPQPARLAFQGTLGGARRLGQLSSQWRLALPDGESGSGKRSGCTAARWASALALAGVATLVAAAFARARGPARLAEELEAPDWWDREPSCSFASGPCPAQQLLESREVCRAVARNAVAFGQRAGENISEEKAATAAAHVFGTLAAKLRVHARGLASELRRTEVSQEDAQAILGMLQLLSDSEVQDVGRTVARAIGDRGPTERSLLTQHIRRHLTPSWDSIRALRNHAVPGPLRLLWGDGDPDFVLWQNNSHRLWEMTLEQSNVMSIQQGGVDEAAEAALAASRGAEFAVFAAAAVQGRAILDILQMHLRARGRNVQVDLGETFEFAFAALSWPCCVDHAAHSDGGGIMQGMVCPLKFGTMGVDALRATFVDDASAAMRPKVLAPTAVRPPALD